MKNLIILSLFLTACAEYGGNTNPDASPSGEADCPVCECEECPEKTCPDRPRDTCEPCKDPSQLECPSVPTDPCSCFDFSSPHNEWRVSDCLKNLLGDFGLCGRGYDLKIYCQNPSNLDEWRYQKVWVTCE